MLLLADVARHGSITAAAHALGYTPSAVSQQVQSLEGEVGLALLERHARGVRLTEAGVVVVTAGEKLRRVLDAAQAELAEVAGLQRGSLRLGCFPTAGASLMPLAITEFRRRHPNVELVVRSARLAGMVGLLETRAVELGLLWQYDWCPIEDAIDPETIAARHLLDDPMELVVARTHPLARRRSVRLEDLAAERWIMREDAAAGEVLLHCCRAAGFDPRVSFEAHDYQEAQGMVAVGLGITMMPSLALTTVRDDVVPVSLGAGAPVRSVLLATVVGRQRTPASDAMVDVLEQVAALRGGRWSSAHAA